VAEMLAIKQVGLRRDWAVMGWAVCCFCEAGTADKCDECSGTDRDPIPWTELYPSARKTALGAGL